MEAQRILLGLLIACVPVAGILYAVVIRRTRAYDPGLLDRIDPKGFRAMNASSQFRFNRYMSRRGYREIENPQLRQLYAALNGLFYAYCLGWVVFLVLAFR